jgi:sugar lactone lactonase YvrE
LAGQLRSRRSLAFLILGLICLLGVAALWLFQVRTPGRAVATLLPKRIQPTVLGWSVHHSVVAGATVPGLQDARGSQARFADPYGVVIDRAGNLYVADAGDNNRIRKIALDGSVTTLAGGAEGFADGAGAAAAFHTPSGLAIDRAGNLYVADTGNNAIRKVTPEGVVSTIAGGAGAGWRDGAGRAAQFNGPLGVALDAHDNLYVADTNNDRIRRIGPDGTVTTVAGSTPGNFDGAAAQALFDTPAAIAVDHQGAVFVADTGNGSVRRLGLDGMVTTVATGAGASAQPAAGVAAGGAGPIAAAASAPASSSSSAAALPGAAPIGVRRPVALAATFDGYLYIADMDRGRIVQLAPDGSLHGLTGVGIDFPVGDARTPRLARPTGLALDPDGSLYVADSLARVVRRLGTGPAPVPAHAPDPPSHPAPAQDGAQPPLASAPAAPRPASFPWPVAPQQAAHEVVGIVGECRGSYDGESRDHFHNGLDVQAEMGTPVLAVAAEKASSPWSNWAYGSVAEGLTLDRISYIHMRVGRDARDRPLDAARFDFLLNEKGKPYRVRLKRGARFAVGDTLGTVNRMYHVHLVQRNPSGIFNPIALPFPGLADSIAPRIDQVFLALPSGQKLPQRRGARVLVRRDGGPLALVAEAWDQMNGNEARRKLGLYRAGYQLLRADGTPLPGYEAARVNIEFNQLPLDDESVKVAYAQGSGITVYGSARTRFLYVLTNVVRDGRAETGYWDPAALAPGDYLIRVLAADHAGNTALAGRDLPITVQ